MSPIGLHMQASGRNNADGKQKSENLDSLDIAKFVLSVAIVAIHAGLGGNWQVSPLYPWLRLAVPIFFIISAFLFFKKYEVADAVGKRLRLTKFVKRNVQLYLFWLIVLIAPTLQLRHYFSDGLAHGLHLIIDGLLFGSTFVASWYIAASVIAIVLIAMLSRFLPDWVLLVFAGLCYLYACFACNYGHVPVWNGLTVLEITGTSSSLFYPYNNFIVGMFWAMVGRLIAKHEDALKGYYRAHKLALIALLVASLFLLSAEQHLIRVFDTALTNDCYITLPFSATLLFVIVLDASVSIKYGKELRAASVITYCLHGTLSRTFFRCLNGGFADYGIAEFFIFLTVCWIVSFAILKLERLRFLRFLKYAH